MNEGKPCGCRRCLDEGPKVDVGMGILMSPSVCTFVVCSICGNKRCPRANDHRNACTNSNEPGQPGSAYP